MAQDTLELSFPIEFIVSGTPVSAQAKRPESRAEWQRQIRETSRAVLPDGHWASLDPIAITLFYLPSEPMRGDIDNIVKLVLHSMNRHIYMDDSQVERIVVQKFEPGRVFAFSGPSRTLTEALTRLRPVLYVRVSNDPFEDLS